MTSALDETLEAEIYRMPSEVLPNATIVSIGHRPTLIALHRRHIEMELDQGGIFEPTPNWGWDPRQVRSHGFRIAVRRDGWLLDGAHLEKSQTSSGRVSKEPTFSGRISNRPVMVPTFLRNPLQPIDAARSTSILSSHSAISGLWR
jgi:hypothetical protein